MDFKLENFDFQTNLLTSREDIDELLDECALQVKTYNLKLGSRELRLDRAQNRSENITEEIAELQLEIGVKEADLAKYTAGTTKYEEIGVEIDYLRARLRRLNLRNKTEDVSPASVVEKNADTGEAQLLLAYFT